MQFAATQIGKVGMLLPARSERRAESAIIGGMLTVEPQNVRLQRARIWSERALAALERESGDIVGGRARLAGAVRDLERLVMADPENRELAVELDKMRLALRN